MLFECRRKAPTFGLNLAKHSVSHRTHRHRWLYLNYLQLRVADSLRHRSQQEVYVYGRSEAGCRDHHGFQVRSGRMEGCTAELEALGVPYELVIASAHRTPAKVHEWASTAADRGIKVIIAAAGKAAHLGGVVAAFTPLPVIGVPMKTSDLGGMDSLLSMVQMPSGVPVAALPSTVPRTPPSMPHRFWCLRPRVPQGYREDEAGDG